MVNTLGEGQLGWLDCDRYGRPAAEHGSASLFPSLQHKHTCQIMSESIINYFTERKSTLSKRRIFAIPQRCD